MPQPAVRSISVIVPAYNAAHLLPDVLASLLAMKKSGEVTEVMVAYDCSRDDTAKVARDLGARVLATLQNGGPGAERNLASAEAVGDILWLVDSDVVAKEGGGDIIRAAFEEQGVNAVFGSYDDAPAGTPWFFRYKNLMRRCYHQHAKREAQTFWAGCGAIDREMYLKVGGFDVETYAVPSIEDIKLGYRIKNARGRILLLHGLAAKHLKIWTIRNAMFTDIFRRALHWSRLMISSKGLTNDLNTGLAEHIKAVVALFLLLQPLVLLIRPDGWYVTVLVAMLALLSNLGFARFLFWNGGPGLAIGGLLCHQVYYVYSATAYACCLFGYHVLPKRNRVHVP